LFWTNGAKRKTSLSGWRKRRGHDTNGFVVQEINAAFLSSIKDWKLTLVYLPFMFKVLFIF